jgi:hypothetical protein
MPGGRAPAEELGKGLGQEQFEARNPVIWIAHLEIAGSLADYLVLSPSLDLPYITSTK